MSRKTDPARARNFASVLQEIFAAPGRSRKDIAVPSASASPR
ncbi:hypothetical protein [Glutamicibacter protophormiae]